MRLAPSGSRARTANPPSGRGPGGELAAEQRHPFAHAGQAVAAAGLPGCLRPTPLSVTSMSTPQRRT